MKPGTLLSVALLILTSPLLVFPQTAPVEPSQEEQEKTRKELESRAIALLNETAMSASALRLAENRISIQMQSAELLWPYDEKKARALYREAASALISLQAERESQTRQEPTSWITTVLRSSLVQSASGKDPQLALDLLRSTRPVRAPQKPSGQERPVRDQDEQLEQMIAASAAKKNPKLAFQLAQEGLKKGVTMTTISLLRQLQQQDVDLASSLVLDIVRQLQSESLTGNGETGVASVELFRSLVRPAPSPTAGATEGSAKPATIKPLNVDEAVLKDLAVIVANLGYANQSRNLNFDSTVMALLPEIEKRAPQQATQLRRRASEAKKWMDPYRKTWTDLEAALSSGSVDQMLAVAAKAPDYMRESTYARVAIRVATNGDIDRARAIVNENMSVNERERVLANIESIASVRAAGKGDINSARQAISAIPIKEKRAEAMANLALQLTEKGDKVGAIKLIDEALSLVSIRPENADELSAVVQIARALASADPERAFDMLDQLVTFTNELIAAMAMVGRFERGFGGYGGFRNGDMVLATLQFGPNPGSLQVVQSLALLARNNFNRAKALSDRFQKEEVRQYARLMIVQRALAPKSDSGADATPEIADIY